MEKKELIHIGTFGKPQGLKGDIKINILTSSLEVFKNFKEFFLKDKDSNLIFESYKKIGKNNVVTMKGCFDRDIALSFKGKKIFTYKNNLPKIKSNEYYILDLIDCKVINKDKLSIGNVVDIKNFGAGDLIEIINKEKNLFYIPMNNDNVISVNLKKKIIIVDPMKGLFD